MYKRYGKRLFDLTVALFMLTPLLFITAVVAILTKFTDGGPVFFVQKRVGRDGMPFKFYKYRSMPTNIGDIPSDQLAALELPVFFRFLRRSNIDEIPQIFNILFGDMSVVGPRPCLISQSELIEFRRESGAIQCTPGLTGYAQVNSFDGMSVQHKANLDGIYCRKIGFLFDISLIFETFLYLSKPPPKY